LALQAELATLKQQVEGFNSQATNDQADAITTLRNERDELLAHLEEAARTRAGLEEELKGKGAVEQNGAAEQLRAA